MKVKVMKERFTPFKIEITQKIHVETKENLDILSKIKKYHGNCTGIPCTDCPFTPTDSQNECFVREDLRAKILNEVDLESLKGTKSR